jgi:hypothetical protein
VGDIVGGTGTVVGGIVGVRMPRGIMGYSTSPESPRLLRRGKGVSLSGVSLFRSSDRVGAGVTLIPLSGDVSGAAVTVTEIIITTAITIATPASSKERRNNRFFMVTVLFFLVVQYVPQCFLFFWRIIKFITFRQRKKGNPEKIF